MSCGADTVRLSAGAPFSYPAAVDPSVRRYAIPVTVENRGDGSLLVSPTGFQARDANRRVYRAEALAAPGDAALIRRFASQRGLAGLGPLQTVSLQHGDTVSGIVVFDVPLGARLAQLVFRSDDTDRPVDLAAPEE